MPKIAFIHNNFPSGGAERVTIDIARYLSSFEGYRVYVLATCFGVGDYRGCITCRSIPGKSDMSKRMRSVEKHIVSEGIDILVLISETVKDIEGIKRRTGVTVVLAGHSAPFWQQYMIMHHRQRNPFLWHLLFRRRYFDGTLALKKAKERTLADYNRCDAYTVLCKGYKEEIEKEFGISSPSSKVTVIENSEPLVADVELSKDKIVLFCGRLENWSKRIDRLLRIWAKIQDRMPDWRLMIVGGGKDEGMLRSLATELGLERVHFEGHSDNPSAFYRKASVVVLTSQVEGWPLVLSEAQANGCICVAFECTAGVRACMGESVRTGFLIRPFDEEAFARQLVKIAGMDAEKQAEIRRSALEWREIFTPDKISQKWKRLFDKLL